MTKLQQLNIACQRAEEATRRAWDMAVEARNQWHLCRSLHVDQEGVWESALRALADYKQNLAHDLKKQLMRRTKR